MYCLDLCPFAAQFRSQHQRCIGEPPIISNSNEALKDRLEQVNDGRTNRLDKAIEGKDDLFLISIIRVFYFFVLYTVALRRVFPFMTDLIAGLGESPNEILEQPDTPILVIPCDLWMLEDDLNDEIQQMR